MSKYELTLADDTVKNYSRKVDAVKAGDNAGGEYRLVSPSGVVLVDTLPTKQATARAKVGTFDVTGKPDQTHACVGACGETLAVKKFPTTSDARRRVAECRVCRDARTKAEKAAKASA